MELRVLSTNKIGLWNLLDFLSRNGLHLVIRNMRSAIGAVDLRVNDSGSVVVFSDGQDESLVERETRLRNEQLEKQNGYWKCSMSTLPDVGPVTVSSGL